MPEDGDASFLETRRTLEPIVAQGNAEAQLLLGSMHFKGQGGPADLVEARRLFGLAAAQGDAAAQTNLGRMLSKG